MVQGPRLPGHAGWRGACLVLIATAMLTSGGCSCRREDKWTRMRPPTFAAGGTLLVDGKPMEGVKVQFERAPGDDGRPRVAFGYTDARGRFRLSTFRDGDGAVEGQQGVMIERVTTENLPKPPGAEVAPAREVSHLPERYRSAKTSGLTATVSAGGRNEFSFSITSQ